MSESGCDGDGDNVFILDGLGGSVPEANDALSLLVPNGERVV